MRVSRTALLAAAVAAGALVVAACVGRRGASAEGIVGRTWLLAELGGAAVGETAGMPRPSIRLEPGGRLVGQGGCNGFGGRWAIEDGRLVTSELMSTKRACVDDALNERETRFLALVGGRPRATVSGDTLRLDDAAGGAPAGRLVASAP